MSAASRHGPSFVAGATGYVGKEVVAALAARQADVVAHVRPDSPRLDEWRQRFETLGAQVDDTAWTAEAMTDRLTTLRPAAVFALLGTTKKRGDSYESVDRDLTLLLHAAALACRPPESPRPRFVYLSAVGADRPRGAYMRVRAEVEATLRKHQVDLPFTIVRPSFITGPDREEDRPGERLGAALVDGAVGLAGLVGARRLRERLRSITGADLARTLVTAAFDPAWANQVVEGADLRRIGA